MDSIKHKLLKSFSPFVFLHIYVVDTCAVKRRL